MSQISFEKAIEIALEQHRAGHFERAQALYMEILRQDPGNVDAMHLLGVLAHQGKRSDLAEQMIGRAISRRDDVAIYHYNFGEALRAQNKMLEAAAAYRRALELEPNYAESANNLSLVLIGLQQYVEAATAARQAIEINPDAAVPYNNLGNALRAINNVEPSEAAYRKALALDPDFVDALNNLATLVGVTGRADEAVSLLDHALRLDPSRAHLHNNRGTSLTRLNRHAEAAHAFEKALELRPDYLEASNNFGVSLRTLGHPEQALAHFRKAVELDPDFAPGLINLASTLKDLAQYDEALTLLNDLLERKPDRTPERFVRSTILRDLYRMDEAVEDLRIVLQAHPDDVQAATSLAYTLLERGDMDEAKAALSRSVHLNPDPGTLSNVLMTANYHSGYTPADLHAMHKTWGDLHETPHRARWGSYLNDRSVGRKLRIGYVSPDFRSHVVGHFLEPILEHHDHSQFEVFAYAKLTNVDMRTWKMRAHVDHWREVGTMTPDEVAQQIREDRIDILVELAGHTANNQLQVFARKPAPVQINMIGFPSTTGLSGIDYRITDAMCDPPGVSDPFNTEKLLRMPKVFWTFLPTANSPDVGPLPADQNGYLTFTSVNNFTKVTPDVQYMWARLLLAAPGSRIIFQTGAMGSELTRAAVRKRFAEMGVEADRLDFRPFSDMRTFQNLINNSDLTLDPFPFNGGTTTCHSLWMGAPVITLAGDRHASRMGLSMMTSIGLPEFVAHTPEEYVEIGQRIAADLPRLREIRAGMRDRLLTSPLFDGPGYTRDLEVAYRDVWTTWCNSGA